MAICSFSWRLMLLFGRPHSDEISQPFSTLLNRNKQHRLLLLSPANLGVAAVKDDVGSLEGNITKNGEWKTARGLDTTEALAAAGLAVVDQATGDGDLAVSNSEGEVGESGAAVKDVSALLLVLAGTLDVLVVSGDEVVAGEEKSGTGIGNGAEGSTNVTAGAELPETLAVVDGSVEDLAGVGGDGSEDVAAGSLMAEIGNEDGSIEASGDVVEPSLLLGGLDCVDGAESETNEAVILALGELVGDFLG